MTDATVAPLLSVSNLSVAFQSEAGAVNAVRSVSYDVRPGELIGIVGESGSGKSVSSLAIMNLLPGHARVTGSARLNGQELIGRSDAELSEIRGRQIAMVFQDPLSALTPVYTVGDQLAEAVLVHEPVGRAAAHARAVELLALVGIPNPQQRAAAFPHEFSGGMRQRVMIAMAIANSPALIIADEPTTALDVTIQAQIMDVLQTARRVTGAAIILITHDLGVIAGVADRVAVMYAGTIVETGTVDDVFYRPRMPYTLGLLGSIPRADVGEQQPLTPIEGSPPSLVALPPGCPFTPRCPMRQPICSEEEPALLALAASGEGHRSACHFRDTIERDNLTPTDIFPAQGAIGAVRVRGNRSERPAVIDVRGLVKAYPLMKGAVLRRRVGEVRAVDGVSFDVKEGETLGLVGESGCGKTTTIMEILNLQKPASGSIRVLGVDTADMSAADRFATRRNLQVVFQDPMASLDPRMPVGDILAEPMRAHGVPPAEVSRRVHELLQLVGLQSEHVNRYPAAFSGGQRQRIGIARALALEPKVLVLDEPVSALDVSIRAGVINLLERLRAELGLSYLFVAHDLAVVRHIADRVAVMYLGWIIEIGDVQEVFEAPAHPYTQALLSAIPLPDPRKERQRRRIVLQGDLPSPANPPSGCRFRTRCQKFANELTDVERTRCINESPALAPRTGSPDHLDACHWATPSSYSEAGLTMHHFTTAPRLMAALVIAVTATSCTQGSGAAMLAATAATQNQIRPMPRDQVQDGGTFTWTLDDVPPNFNYNQLDGTEDANFRIIAGLMPGAYDSDASGAPIWNRDLLASEPVVIIEPTQVVTYEINPRAAWDDGTPITWEDFHWQWRANNGTDKRYQIGSSNGYDAIERVERGGNDREVVVSFKRRYADWQAVFGPLFPASTNRDPKVFNEGWKDRPLLTAGPFKLDSVDVTSKTVTLVRNEKWWGSPAKLDRMVFRIIDPDAQIDAIANGEIDAMDVGPDANKFMRARDIEGTDLRFAGGPNFRHLTMNGTSTNLQDVRVRKALAMAISRPAISRALLAPLGIKADPLDNHIFMKNQAGYRSNAGEVGTYNPEKAKALLDEAGWKMDGDVRRKDGRPLELTAVIPGGVATSKQETELMLNMLAQVGVRLIISTVPSPDFFSRYITPGQFDFTVFSWIGTPYPMSSARSLYSMPTKNASGELDVQQNYARIGTPEIDRLFDETSQELDRTKAIELANQLDALIWDEVHSLTLYQRPEIVVCKQKLVNFGAFGFASWTYSDIGWAKEASQTRTN